MCCKGGAFSIACVPRSEVSWLCLSGSPLGYLVRPVDLFVCILGSPAQPWLLHTFREWDFCSDFLLQCCVGHFGPFSFPYKPENHSLDIHTVTCLERKTILPRCHFYTMIYRINTIHIIIPMASPLTPQKWKKLILKFKWHGKKPQIAKHSWERRTLLEDIYVLISELTTKRCNQNSVIQAWEQACRSVEYHWKFRNEVIYSCQLIFDKGTNFTELAK